MSTADGKANEESVFTCMVKSLERCPACCGTGRDPTVSYWVPCLSCDGRGVRSQSAGDSKDATAGDSER